MLVPEYDLNNPATWYVIRERDVISESEDKWFQQELNRIAGWNPFGSPNLVRRWAATYFDPMTTDPTLKYFLSNNDPTLIGFVWNEKGVQKFSQSLADIPLSAIAAPQYNNEQLGQRRHVVEIWRSPEFLAKSGRYVETVRRDPENGEVLLREFPRIGTYDCFLILETAEGKYHAADGEAIQGIRLLWEELKKPASAREATIKKGVELKRKEVKRRQDEAWANA